MSGIKVHCNHCGYTWLYTGSNEVTSCPKCGWRVRVHSRQRLSTPGGDRLLPKRRNDRLI